MRREKNKAGSNINSIWGASMQTTRPRPVAECIRCGKTSIFTDHVSKRCYLLEEGKYCLGVFMRRLRKLDWAPCLQCNGMGLTYCRLCLRCKGIGWVKGRRV